MEANGVQGVQVGGREPKALLMSDGSRLALEDEGPGGRADWMLLGDDAVDDRELSVADAIRVAGDRHADYVRIRTRSEVAWLRLVSEWFEQEARRLDGELTATVLVAIVARSVASICSRVLQRFFTSRCDCATGRKVLEPIEVQFFPQLPSQKQEIDDGLKTLGRD